MALVEGPWAPSCLPPPPSPPSPHFAVSPATPPETSGHSPLPVVHVHRSHAHALSPKPGDEVMVRVTRTTQRTTVCEILCIGQSTLAGQPFSGVIRQQDVRLTEIDKVEMTKCFRPGDIVRAEVIALGDARSYFLTTAKDELGVVFARSFAGKAMMPVDWTHMKCPETGVTEERKCAKVL